jgi:hypothetical protein
MIVFLVQNRNRYIVHFKFSLIIINEIKKIKDFKYNSSCKSWSIPREGADELVGNLKRLSIETIIDDTEEDKEEYSSDFYEPAAKRFKISHNEREKDNLIVHLVENDCIEINIPIKRSIYHVIKNIVGADFRSNILTLKGSQFEEFKRLCEMNNINVFYN